MSAGRYLLAVDVGTGSCRAVLFDLDGRQVAVGQREWFHHEPDDVPGGQDFTVAENWRLICACIREAVVKAGIAPAEVAAVSATSMREGFVLYDERGTELWACPNVDSRATAQAEQLVRSGAAAEIYQTAGDWVSITAPARLRWLAQHHPEILARASSLGMLSDWVVSRLADVRVTDASCGSSSGMFDLSSRIWSEQIARLTGVPLTLLPPVVESGTRVGEITEQAALDTGLRAGTPVVTGGADTQLGLAAAGVQTGELAIVGGTFWQTTMLVDRPVIDPRSRLRTLCHVDPTAWMIEGIGFYSGLSMRWIRDALCDTESAIAAQRGVDPYEVMEEVAATAPPGSNGVVAILSNVMNARRWVHASPTFTQFDINAPALTGRAAFIRAVAEAAAYVARAHRDIITEVTGTPVDHAVFTGGACRSKLWTQIVADVLGVPVEVPRVAESSALGAAIAAGIGVGIYSSHLDVPGLRDRLRTVEPNKTAADFYVESYERWQALYDRHLAIAEAGHSQPMWRAAGADRNNDQPHEKATTATRSELHA